MNQNDHGQVLQRDNMSVISNKSISEIESTDSGKYIAYENKDEPPQEQSSVQASKEDNNQEQQQPDTILGLDDDHGLQQERAFRYTVHCIVANNLFPRIKFLDKTRDLEFSMEEGTICHYVFHMCNLKYDIENGIYLGKGQEVGIV